MRRPLTIYIAYEDGSSPIYVAHPTENLLVELEMYDPGAPDQDVVQIVEEARDGAEIASANIRNPTGRIVGLIPQTDEADNYRQILADLLEQARDYQRTRLGKRVFLYEQRSANSPVWRSEIVAGRYRSDASVIEEIGMTGPQRRLTILFTRRYYWEGDEVALPLTNRNGTAVTTPLSISGHHDASNDNFVSLGPVAGEMPTPPIVKIKNTLDSTNRMREVYLALNSRSLPDTFSHILQGEAAASGGTTETAAAASGGQYRRFTWSATTETEAISWDLSSSLLNACRGNFFRIMMWLHNSVSLGSNVMEVRFDVQFLLSTIYQSRWAAIRTGKRLQETVSLQLPPYLVGAGDLYPLKLVMFVKAEYAGSKTLDVDFLQLSPLDGWRKLTPKGYGAANGVTLTDDMTTGHVYTEGWATAGKTGHYLSDGPPMMLRPRQAQRLYFLMGGMSSDTIARTATVQVSYRPRRVAI